MWMFMIWALRSSDLTCPKRDFKWMFNRYLPAWTIFSLWDACTAHQVGRYLASDGKGDEWMQKSNIEEIRPIFTMRAQPKAAYLPCSSDLTEHVWGVWESAAMWKRDGRLLLPWRHWGYLAELHKDTQSFVSVLLLIWTLWGVLAVFI